MSAVGVAVGSDLVVWRVRAQATRLEEPNHGLGGREATAGQYVECKVVLSIDEKVGVGLEGRR